MTDLSPRFRALASSDRERVPSFEATLGAARRRPLPRERASAVPALSAVALGMILALSLVSRFGPDGSLPAAISRAEALSGWTAPTAVFLDPLDRTISDSTPTLTLSSVALPE